MTGLYFFATIFLFIIPFGFFTPAPPDDLTINLNLNEGYEQHIMDDNDRHVTNPNRDVTDVNKKQFNDYEDGDVLNLNECVKEKDVGYNEDRFDIKAVGGEEECANWCGEVEECEFWTFTKLTMRCHLFGPDSVKINSTGRISGTKSCAKGGPNFENEGIKTEEEEDGLLSIQDNGNGTINYAFSGYNVFYGNPIHPRDAAADQGFKKHIFDVKYEGTSTPVGTEIYSCKGCVMDVSTTLMSGTAKYQKSLQEIANVGTTIDFDAFQAKFSASTNYRTVEEQTSNHSNFISHSQLECCAYRINMLSLGKRPPYSENFVESVRLLTDEYDAQLYNQFIKEFGTHYVTQADFGSLFGEQTIISRESWMKMESEGIEIGAAASASAVVEFFAANSSTNSTNEDLETFDKYNTVQLQYTLGSMPPSDNKATTWLKETKKDPMPIKFHLSPILDLFSNKSGGLNVSKAVTDNLKKVYEDYCERLKNATEVKSCDAPGPDPDFPSRDFTRTWKDWLTKETKGERLDPKICDDFTYITWVEFIYFNWQSNPLGSRIQSYPIFINLKFGCSNGKVYNLTGEEVIDTDALSADKTSKLTCNNKNGFMKMTVQVADQNTKIVRKDGKLEPVFINAALRCFDDSKDQYALSDEKNCKVNSEVVYCLENKISCYFCIVLPICNTFDPLYWCKWTEWVACDEDKNERMVGLQMYQKRMQQHNQDFQVMSDIRFQCATFK